MEQLWDIQNVMDRLGVGKDWVLNRIRSGELPAVRLGKYLKFDPKDVEQLIEKSKTSSLTTELEANLKNRSRRSTKGDLWQR